MTRRRRIIGAYYSEWDPYAAAWLRNLIARDLIPAGDIDERDVRDVSPADVMNYDQCHFFAGIGGWPLALQLARWADDRRVWTGSCPCQGESVAGKKLGIDDERHLWPDWFRLIRECRPPVVFGEQVARASGTHWFDGVCADLEGCGYAVGAAVLPACAVDAPHRRERLWFVANAHRVRPQRAELAGRRAGGRRPADEGGVGIVGNSEGKRPPAGPDRASEDLGTCEPQRPSAWSGAARITCADGKSRRVEPGIRLLAHGVPARVGRLRAYGNAIAPQVAAAFVEAYMACRP